MMFISFSSFVHPMSMRLLSIIYGDEIPVDAIMDAATGDGWIIIPFEDCVMNDGGIDKKHYEDGNNYSE